ncbi:MAG: heme lyase CcmF/NrfE family subunit [Gammaproteobacteria bacterium]|nr:MAG: heme lyase CcmF/NrfE family subunit [Gammaproteobacteria bacterium]
MIPEIGHFALIIALCLAFVQTVVPIIGAQTNTSQWIGVAKPAARGQFLFIVISYICLTYSFIKNDFSVLYVANNANTALPLQYKISAVWGAHEGSLLLWVLMLSVWTFAVTIFSRSLPNIMVARVVGVMGFVSVGFLLFMLLTSNPFERIFPIPLEGKDLNPLLQDPGLVIHPPMLYMGYVGFSVAFAFAIAALLEGKLDSAWARWSRPWATMAWVFLTIGITLGSWWAYHELGWGGWWFWDPVENASFMPWLVGTALIHSLAVTEKRSSFKNWTVLLAILAFSLSLLGTFLVRSGVLVSVHAFATDPARGVYILLFLAIVIGGSLLLYALRAPKIKSIGQFELVSRETALLLNNVLLLVAMFTILVGTLYPLFLDALNAGKISVGPPYFNAVFVPLMLPLVFIIGVGPFLRWKKATLKETLKKLFKIIILGLIIGLALPYIVAGRAPILVILGISLGGWSICAALYYLFKSVFRNEAKLNSLQRFKKIPRATYGMVVAHIGIGVFVFGVTFVSAFQEEKEVPMRVGEKIEMAGYEFGFNGVKSVQGPNYSSKQASVNVYKNDKLVATLLPEKRTYLVQQSPMTEAGIDTGFLRDVYVALGEQIDNEAWGMRLYYKPFIQWIWLGAVLMALGGLLAALDRRYRLKLKRENVAVKPVKDKQAIPTTS